MSLSTDTARDAHQQWVADHTPDLPVWPGRCTCGGRLSARQSRWACTGCETPTPTVEPVL